VSNISIVAISVGLPVAVNNPVPKNYAQVTGPRIYTFWTKILVL